MIQFAANHSYVLKVKDFCVIKFAASFPCAHSKWTHKIELAASYPCAHIKGTYMIEHAVSYPCAHSKWTYMIELAASFTSAHSKETSFLSKLFNQFEINKIQNRSVQ